LPRDPVVLSVLRDRCFNFDEVHMFHPYKILLILATCLLPYLVIAYRNRFDDGAVTALRFAASVVVTWGWILCERILVDWIDIRLAVTPEDFASIYDGDGARNCVALFLGWLPAVVLTIACWFVGATLRNRASRKQA
jgi:hypothetical protein